MVSSDRLVGSFSSCIYEMLINVSCAVRLARPRIEVTLTISAIVNLNLFIISIKSGLIKPSDSTD